MPPKQTRSKAPKKGRRTNGKRNSSLPGFTPEVNRSAGPAASGVRVGFPAERTVTLNYCDTGTMISTTGVTAKYQYRLNSAFDPDYTGVGHQPMCFDQWSLFYNHYVVEDCRFDVEIGAKANDATAGGVNAWVGCHLSDDATVPIAPSELMELGSSSALTNPYSNGSTHIFKGTVSTAKFLNRKDIAADSEVRAAITANPTELIFLTVWGVNSDFSSTMTLVYGIKLSMRIRFMEPKDLAPSVLGRALPRTLRPLETEDSPEDAAFEYVRVKRSLKGTGSVRLPSV